MCWASTNGILLTLQVWSLERRDIKFHQELQGLNHWVRALVAHNNFLYSGSYQTIKVLLFVISWPNVWAERIHIQGRRSSGRQGGGSKTVEGNFLGAGIAAINLFLVDLDQPWNPQWYCYEKQLCWRWGCRGCKRTGNRLDLLIFWTKALKIRVKMVPNVVWLQTMVPKVCIKTHEDLSLEVTPKRGLHDLCGRKF